MKKLFAIILAAIMILSISVTAFAEGPLTAEEPNATIDVQGTINDHSGNDIEVYVNWGDLEFTYHKDDYNNLTGETTSYWQDAQVGHITVANHSNIAVGCDFTFAADEENWEGGNLYFEYNETEEIMAVTSNDSTWDASTATLLLDAPTAEDFPNPEDENSSYNMPAGVVNVTVNSEAAPTTDGSLGTITLYVYAQPEATE
ncbi:MAG: hypothetical protein J6U68_05265 [Clostridia bacterium]|nr:hypothetical protein [Clostridia bacterium]